MYLELGKGEIERPHCMSPGLLVSLSPTLSLLSPTSSHSLPPSPPPLLIFSSAFPAHGVVMRNRVEVWSKESQLERHRDKYVWPQL